MSAEVLAPVGNKEMLIAAIESEADAIYLAGKNFGARAFAGNFTNEELSEAIKTAHLYGISVFVTVNTIIFESEIEEAIEFLDFLYLNDCDGVIVQDLGLASIINNRYPKMRLHASTQLNAQTYDDVLTLKKIGFDRVILGREVSLDVIKEIYNKKIENNIDIEIEVFAHGALCISYSGNCFFSSINGGRSGNRGRCTQPCRLLHSFSNGEEIHHDSFYLSPKDLCTIDYIKEISKYVDSLKIEGRMKSKEYVYRVVTAYKKALSNVSNKETNKLEKEKFELKLSFNREYTKGFILNENNTAFTNTNFSNHQGVLIGQIVSSKNEKASICLTSNLKMNDSIRIVGETIDAVTINAMYKGRELVKEAKANDVINIKLHKEMQVNDKVYLTKREEEYTITRKIPITGKGYIENDYFVLTITDGLNTVTEKIKYQETDKNHEQRIKEQIGKIGSTSFIFNDLTINASNIFIPISEINELRRKEVEELVIKREKRNGIREIINTDSSLDCEQTSDNLLDGNLLDDNLLDSNLSIVYSNKEQIIDINDLYPNLKVSNYYYRQKDLFTEKRNTEESAFWYIPRVHSKVLEKNVVASNLGNISSITSVYMNVTNSLTVKVLEDLGATKVGLSIELSKTNIQELITGYKKRYGRNPNLEIQLYGYYQMMYMKHCFINKEYGFTNKHCNKCNQNVLLDKKYPVFNDGTCNLSILYREPVCLFPKINELKEMGITNFLLDFTIESREEVENVIKNYLDSELYDEGYFGLYQKTVE